MILERLKSEGLAHHSYFLGSGTEAAVIDPRRDVEVYLKLAQERGLRLRYLLETHRNEDFVIGSRELESLTGAPVYHGPGLDWKYGHTLEDGQELPLGHLGIRVLHTPGHTDESVCYAVTDTSVGEVVVVFTGDTLFVGDVGRTDLCGEGEVERLARNLYRSLRGKLLPLGDGVSICPAHGGGSICGGHIAERETSTIGLEKATNPALQVKGEEEFVRLKQAERLEKPPYFRRMEQYNLEGPPVLGGLTLPPPLSPPEFRAGMKECLVLDTREPASFGVHIPGSYHIWREGLPGFAGWVLPYDRPVLLVLEDASHLEQVVRYLVRLGYDPPLAGYLRGGVEGWYNAGYPVEKLALLTVHDLKDKLDRGEKLTVLDVRGQEEWDSGHIRGAKHIYVGHLAERLAEVPQDKPATVLCNVGRRASLGASILLRAGYTQIGNVLGSMTAWRAAGYPVTREKS